MARARKPVRRDPITDNGVSDEWDVFVHTQGATGRGFPERHSLCGIELRGQLTAGLNGVTAFEFMLTPKSEKELKTDTAVGNISKVKPAISGLVNLTPEEFATALALTTSGRPVHFRLSMDKPRYGWATIFSFAMGLRPIE
jgi:hypothetical protein